METKKNLVSIIIINWNGIKDLKDLMPSLKKVKYKNFETIIVDHGSTDGSIEYIKKYHPKVKLLEKGKNLGFAKGNNVGYKSSSGEYVLFLNNDTVVEPGFLNYLVEALKDKKIAVVQPKIIFADSKKLQSAGTFFTDTGFLYHYGYDKDPTDEKYNKPSEIFSANGSCMLVKREVIEKVGLFDEDFFLYFEETDFCWRVWLAGYFIKYIPESVIYHKGGRATKRLPSAFINFHSSKNRINAILKNLDLFGLVRILPIQLILNGLATLVFLLKGGFSVAWSMQRAIFWNIKNTRDTLNKRKKVQEEIRKISDDEIFSRVKKNVRPSYYLYLFLGLEKYED